MEGEVSFKIIFLDIYKDVLYDVSTHVKNVFFLYNFVCNLVSLFVAEVLRSFLMQKNANSRRNRKLM